MPIYLSILVLKIDVRISKIGIDWYIESAIARFNKLCFAFMAESDVCQPISSPFGSFSRPLSFTEQLNKLSMRLPENSILLL
jgi:hypothetical protein